MAKFAKGVSGNPGGRPKALGDLRDIARQHTDEAIQVLIAVMGNAKAAPSARVGAATALLDRGWGRPTVTVTTNQAWNGEIDAGLVGTMGDILARISGEAKANSENKRETEPQPIPAISS